MKHPQQSMIFGKEFSVGMGDWKVGDTFFTSRTSRWQITDVQRTKSGKALVTAIKVGRDYIERKEKHEVSL